MLTLARTVAATACLMLVGASMTGPVAASLPPSRQPQTDAFYIQQLAAAGLKVIERQDVDLTGDGQPETLLLAVGVDCGGCHSKRLIIFSGPRPLADVSLDDPVIEPHPGVGVWITQPARLPDEPLCCWSGTYTLQLLWDPRITEVDGIDVPGRFVFGSPVEIGPGLLHPRAPLHSVAAYYALFDAGLFEQAHALVATRVLARDTFQYWLQDNRPQGELLVLKMASVPQTSGQVRVEVAEYEAGAAHDAPLARYSGIWQTVPEDDIWRLDTFLID